MADSDSTDGSKKINAARSSGELMSLSRAAIETDVAAFFRDRESVTPIARLHNMTLHRTALLRLDENLPHGVVPPIRRLSEVELRGMYSSFVRILSPTSGSVKYWFKSRPGLPIEAVASQSRRTLTIISYSLNTIW
jgi:hypothetical protein